MPVIPSAPGPYRLIISNETESVWDRRDDWWGAETGFKDLPAPERVIFLAAGNEERRAAMAINNELDTMWLMGRSTFETVVAQNPAVTGWYSELALRLSRSLPALPGGQQRRLAIRQCGIALGHELRHQPRRAGGHRLGRHDQHDQLDHARLPASCWNTWMPAPISLKPIPPWRHNQDKVDELMTGAMASACNADGLWVDGDGNTVQMDLAIRQGETFQVKMAPVIAELLQRAGFDATFKLQDNAAFNETARTGGANAWIDVACGAVRDPYGTLDNFHSRHSAPLGDDVTGSRTRLRERRV